MVTKRRMSRRTKRTRRRGSRRRRTSPCRCARPTRRTRKSNRSRLSPYRKQQLKMRYNVPGPYAIYPRRGEFLDVGPRSKRLRRSDLGLIPRPKSLTDNEDDEIQTEPPRDFLNVGPRTRRLRRSDLGLIPRPKILSDDE